MTTKAQLVAAFVSGAVPTETNYSNLISACYTGEIGAALVSAAEAGSTGIIRVVDASTASLIANGSAGRAVLAQDTAFETYVSAASNIQTALDAAAAAGGGIVRLSRGVHSITTTLTITGDGVILAGQGAAYDIDTDPPGMDGVAPTALKWTGSAGGTVLQVKAVSGASNRARRRAGVIDLHIEGDNLAAKGLEVLSVKAGRFERISIRDCTTVALDVDVVASLVEARDTQHCAFRDISIRQVLASSGIGLRLDGDTVANSSLNLFENFEINHDDGNAIELGAADANTFIHMRVYHQAGGTGLGLELKAGASTDHAHDNFFYDIQTNTGGATARAGAASSASNVIYGYSTNNGSPLPVIENGATLSYYSNSGVDFQSRSGNAARHLLHRSAATGTQLLAEWLAQGPDSAGTITTYGGFQVTIADNTDTSEDGRISFRTSIGGVDTISGYFQNGFVLGTPTGGALGLGTINCKDAYNDSVALTCAPARLLKDGVLDLALWDRKTLDGRQHAVVRRFKAMMDEGFDPRDPVIFAARLKADGAVPGLMTEAEWDAMIARKDKPEMGQTTNRIMLALDNVAVALAGLVDRVEAIDARLAALEKTPLLSPL